MPICIAGMHRSGTSMTTRLLSQLGLYLGEPDEFLAPASDNPEGYWEHEGFVRLNDAVLQTQWGTWDAPPYDAEAGWELEPEVVRLQDRAERLLDRFAGREPWGWKDPRNSLTLPFWQRMLPDVRVVICVRSPLEVARSLQRRGGTSMAYGFNLWRTYYERLLAAVPEERRIVTHYDTYFGNAPTELFRLADWLEIPVRSEAMEAACASVNTDLRHHQTSAEELRAMPGPVFDLYARLCIEAGVAHLLVPPLDLGDARPVRLLCIPDWEGSGWETAVRSYVRAFHASDPVSLILRVEPPHPERVESAFAQASALLSAMAVDGDAVPDIVFESSPLAPLERGALYKAATAFLPVPAPRTGVYVCEAQACGLPVIDPSDPDALRAAVSGLRAWMSAVNPAAEPVESRDTPAAAAARAT